MASKVFADGKRLEHLPGYMGMTLRHTDDTKANLKKAWVTSATLPWEPPLRMCYGKHYVYTTNNDTAPRLSLSTSTRLSVSP